MRPLALRNLIDLMHCRSSGTCVSDAFGRLSNWSAPPLHCSGNSQCVRREVSGVRANLGPEHMRWKKLNAIMQFRRIAPRIYSFASPRARAVDVDECVLLADVAHVETLTAIRSRKTAALEINPLQDLGSQKAAACHHWDGQRLFLGGWHCV